MTIKKDIVREVTAFYLESHDYNGKPIRAFFSSDRDKERVISIVKSLVEEGRISLTFGDRHPNPHIKAFREESIEIQISKLDKLNLDFVCLYPTPKELKNIVQEKDYSEKPFELKLALGAAQLDFLPFDLSVLEFYRNDPRYRYQNDDISGSIMISDDYMDKVPESDGILLQTLGFAYDDEYNRAVAVFMRYLADLSPEHQQIWRAKQLGDGYNLHPDYARRSAGDWGTGVSIFDAFLEEIKHINEMCKLMERPCLFKQDYRNNKPVEFSFLIRPTAKEYDNFILLLDKMISDNINKKFFQREIPYEREQVRKDGKIIIVNKNTLALLEEWIDRKIIVVDKQGIENMIGVFKTIRKKRQGPAHYISENHFDQQYFKDQRKIITDAYTGIRTIRLLFANHPQVKNYKIPEWLQTGTIWNY